MKKNLIIRFCTTRKRIDLLAKQLGLSNIGAREVVMERINNHVITYKELRNAIKQIS